MQSGIELRAKLDNNTILSTLLCQSPARLKSQAWFPSCTYDHIPLGVGTVDWKNAVDVLKATRYDGTITLEIFCNDPKMQYKYLAMSRNLILELWN